MTVVDPETGDVDHRQDDPAVVETAADQLSEAMLALEGVDYNALRDDQLRTVLAAKDSLSTVCKDLRQHQHTCERRDGGGDR